MDAFRWNPNRFQLRPLAEICPGRHSAGNSTQPSILSTSQNSRPQRMHEQPQPIKQIIVMRHDLKMRRGKQIAQGAHASMSFLCRRLQDHDQLSLQSFSDAQQTWLTGAFAKVCCRVNSEEELMTIYEKATSAGLEVHLITDSGKTEFHGQPTRTCLAIGPDFAAKIDPITGHLELL